ncbi:MAG: hypothetical protein HY023_10595 [Chloroflexi bacterium]|nr:hypothetical protein [Chloroflexota bacterium]
MPKHALFAGLVVDENEEPVEVAYIGDEPHYVVNDAGFRRHVEASVVDRHVFGVLREQILAHKDIVLQSTLQMIGKDDLFTKAMVDSSLEHLDDHFDRLIETGMPPGAIEWLGMMGFRIVIDVHGEVVRMQPSEFGIAEEE